ncbi:MAG: LysR family transcriptional regulator [Methylotenera sp.]|nr:LysR family transcriptional regulator [Methylotenera sp.]
MINLQFKIRISNGDAIAMGPGKAELLTFISELGSISAAAKRMQMSYRRAWELVDVMNSCFDQPLVLSNVGGSHGGGAQLTEFGSQILANYHTILLKSQAASANELAFIAEHLKQSD